MAAAATKGLEAGLKVGVLVVLVAQLEASESGGGLSRGNASASTGA